MTDRFGFLQVNGDLNNRVAHILSVSVDSAQVRMEGEMLVPTLDIENVAVTSGSACSSGSMQPSHVLLAMGKDVATAKATIRFSLGKGNTKEDVLEAVERFSAILERMTKQVT